jgi:hypothetical protein
LLPEEVEVVPVETEVDAVVVEVAWAQLFSATKPRVEESVDSVVASVEDESVACADSVAAWVESV